MQREAVVEVGEGDAVLGPDRLTNDDLVDIVELVPVLLSGRMEWKMWNGSMRMGKQEQPSQARTGSPDLLLCLHQGFKLRSTRDGQVEGFGSEERLQVKQVKVIFIHQICQQLVAKAIEGGHYLQGKVPMVVGGAIHQPGGEEGEERSGRKEGGGQRSSSNCRTSTG